MSTASSETEGKKAADAKLEQENEEDDEDFNVMQKWVFPIHIHELAKVVPVVLLMATALFIYTGLRDIKDPIVFGGEGQEMMTVQYCKVLVMMVAVPVAAIFLKLDNMVSRDFIFFQTVLTFASYFLLNGYMLYPCRDALHQYGSTAVRSSRYTMSEENQNRVLPLLGVFMFPINTLTYVFSEMWGTISLSFLVWGYVNQVTPKTAAKRYYAVLGLGGQFGSMLGGVFVGSITLATKGLGEQAFSDALGTINLVMTVMCVLFAAVYAFLQFYVMKLPQFEIKKVKKKSGKPKMSVGEAFKYCLGNGYVLSLCGMVFAYGFVMVIGELSYKDIMKLSYDDDQSSFATFKSFETSMCAVAAIVLMIFVGHNVIRLCGWLVTALLTPVVAALLLTLLYIMALSRNFYDPKTKSPAIGSEDYLETLRNVGLIFAVVSKSVKYSSFDPAKELAFLALNSEQKYKAKAAVDIIGARFGKGAGALFNIIVINFIMHLKKTYITEALWASLVGVLCGLVLWCFSDVYIARSKAAVTEKNNEEAIRNAEPLESLEVEGAAASKDTTATHGHEMRGIHVEMSTLPDASFTAGGAYPTPMPSRAATPEAGLPQQQ